MDGLTADDVAAMRRQGDFRAFLRTLTAATPQPQPRPAPAAPAEPPPGRDPDRRPGAWPAGTRRPAPNTTALADWQDALADYRTWDQAGRPKGDHTCHCGTCPKGAEQ